MAGATRAPVQLLLPWTEFRIRWHSLAEGIVSGKITTAENHEQEKGHRRGQIRGELDESQVSVFFSSYFEPRNPIFGVSLFLGVPMRQ